MPGEASARLALWSGVWVLVVYPLGALIKIAFRRGIGKHCGRHRGLRLVLFGALRIAKEREKHPALPPLFYSLLLSVSWPDIFF